MSSISQAAVPDLSCLLVNLPDTLTEVRDVECVDTVGKRLDVLPEIQ